jgi:hypothetical protein
MRRTVFFMAAAILPPLLPGCLLFTGFIRPPACGDGLSTEGEFCPSPAESLAVGLGPDAVVIADLDGDGRQDLIAANSDADTLTTFSNTGGGRLDDPATILVGDEPHAIVVADLDDDGRQDIAVANFLSSTVTVLFAEGPVGGFTATTLPTDFGGAFGLVGADLDGDGDTDLAATNRQANEALVFLNVAAREFSGSQIIAVGVAPEGIAAGDLDGDGRVDLVTANFLAPGAVGDVSLLRNLGGGNFAAAESLPAGRSPGAVALADLDLDGDLDIAVANNFGGTISVFLNDGGEFGAGLEFEVGDLPEFLAVGDLNGDGRPDIVTANADSDTATAVFGDGAGRFSPPSAVAVGAFPLGVALGDLNEDGALDIATANFNTNDVSVIFSAL